MFFFTFPLVEHSSTQACEARKKLQKRVNLLAFSPTCSYIAKVTPRNYRGGSLRTFVPNCKFDITFHVKHCKSKLKTVYIIPVRIEKRESKKGSINTPCYT